MSRLFYHVMQDNVGNLLFDVSGTMRIAGTGTLATIYGDEALTAILPNPMTNHPSFGSFKCFLGAGDYDFYMAKGGYTFETLTGVQGHGTMAQQDANNVAITGGTVIGTVTVESLKFESPDSPGEFTSAFVGEKTAGTNRWNLYCNGTAGNYVEGRLGVGRINAGAKVDISYPKQAMSGILLQQNDNDVGGNAAIYFLSVGGPACGGIHTTATTTAYTTSSDARLKDDVQPLRGALDVIRALNPVAFRWKADASAGRGLLAQEVQNVIPDGVITGERGAVDAEGNVQPQMIDYSKLVPYLIGAVKELAQQVEMLQAQLAEASA